MPVNYDRYQVLCNATKLSMFVWSEEVVKIFFKSFNLTQVDIIDLGTNIGMHCENFKDIIDDNTLILLEPDKNNLKILENYLNSVSYKFVLYKNPILHIVKHIYFEETSNGELSKVVSDKPANIHSITVDIISKNYNIKCIKIDVEGQEINAIRGGQETIKRDRPIIATEWSTEYSTKDMIWYYNFFKTNNYMCIDLFGDIMDLDHFIGKAHPYWNRFIVPQEMRHYIPHFSTKVIECLRSHGLPF